MTKIEIEIDVEIPEGYEATGEFREPSKHEWFLSSYGEPMQSRAARHGPRLILRKAKQWRDPVLPADWGKEARFSDGKTWQEGRLTGYNKESTEDVYLWQDDNEDYWKFCQIAD